MSSHSLESMSVTVSFFFTPDILGVSGEWWRRPWLGLWDSRVSLRTDSRIPAANHGRLVDSSPRCATASLSLCCFLSLSLFLSLFANIFRIFHTTFESPTRMFCGKGCVPFHTLTRTSSCNSCKNWAFRYPDRTLIFSPSFIVCSKYLVSWGTTVLEVQSAVPPKELTDPDASSTGINPGSLWRHTDSFSLFPPSGH